MDDEAGKVGRSPTGAAPLRRSVTTPAEHSGADANAETAAAPRLPSISLPKGGRAIERRAKLATGVSHGRTVSRDNLTGMCGDVVSSQVADPVYSARLFERLASRNWDDKSKESASDHLSVVISPGNPPCSLTQFPGSFARSEPLERQRARLDPKPQAARSFRS